MAAIILGTWWFLMNQNEPRNQLAVPMFGIMTGSTTLYCLLSGLVFTADCLSQEKREGTLGLLFLADLRGYDVVIGKLAATSVGALYGVLAVVPMLGVPLLIGGVTPGEFGRMALVILNTLFFSLTLGLAVSAISRSGRKAMVATFLLILLIAVVPPIIVSVCAAVGVWPQAQTLILSPSPGFTFAMAFDASFKTGSVAFWWSLGLVHGLAWFFLAVASLAAPRSWQERPAAPRIPAWRRLWARSGHGNEPDREMFRRELLDKNAFFWLAARARQRPAYVWAVLGLLALVWSGFLIRMHTDWLNSAVYVTTALVLNCLIKFWVAAESSRQLAEDRQDGTLELLLSTSLSVEDILRGQWLALARQFLAPVLVILGVLFAFLLGTLHDPDPGGDERLFSIWFYAMGMVVLVADLVALYWLGMWRGLTAKNPQRAFLGSVLRILVLPWIGMAGAALFLALGASASRYDPGTYTWFNLWILFGLTTDVGFASWARFKLLSEFRLAAAGRFDSRTPQTAPQK
jgi:ABC-type Na+ efflux pump permease subunit